MRRRGPASARSTLRTDSGRRPARRPPPRRCDTGGAGRPGSRPPGDLRAGRGRAHAGARPGASARARQRAARTGTRRSVRAGAAASPRPRRRGSRTRTRTARRRARRARGSGRAHTSMSSSRCHSGSVPSDARGSCVKTTTSHAPLPGRVSTIASGGLCGGGHERRKQVLEDRHIVLAGRQLRRAGGIARRRERVVLGRRQKRAVLAVAGVGDPLAAKRVPAQVAVRAGRDRVRARRAKVGGNGIAAVEHECPAVGLDQHPLVHRR